MELHTLISRMDLFWFYLFSDVESMRDFQFGLTYPSGFFKEKNQC